MDQGKRRLGGRGLDGLFGGPETPPKLGGPMLAPIEEVFPNRRQPRTRFDDAQLEELAASIREMGVLEPILVRRRSAGGFEIIAGERRWRAAQKAGLREVPIHVRELTEQAAFEAALVENLQREDLNPVETARAFERLVREHGHTQDTIAKRVGKDRSTVSNALRLLKLPEQVLALVETGELSEGHGRALLGAGDTAAMLRIAKEAAGKGLSVRDVERRARSVAGAKPGGKKAAKPTSANVRDLESRLARRLGTRVSVADRKGKGHLTIPFSSYDELDRILALLGV